MAEILEITNLGAEELRPYTNTSELSLLREGIFVAESPKVIRTALDSGYEPVSLLVEDKYISGQAADIISRAGDIPVYRGSSARLTELTGFKLTQGVLAAMKRREQPDTAGILQSSRRIAVLENIMNQTNTGAIFRSAAALGFDAVLLTEGCSDPLFRRSVRVSMGTVFQIPWSYITGSSPRYIHALNEAGFVTAAMALWNDTVSIDDERVTGAERLAVVLGTEGDGLLGSTIEACSCTIKIPMSHGVDSLNVAAASAVAFWQLGRR
jgi:tRNA G18 (ribose-2'-O)-methylase SpoU